MAVDLDKAIIAKYKIGEDNFEIMIKKAKELDYQYIGLSDHSPGYATHTKTEIVELIKKRTNKIEQLKSSNSNFGVLNLLEIPVPSSMIGRDLLRELGY